MSVPARRFSTVYVGFLLGLGLALPGPIAWASFTNLPAAPAMSLGTASLAAPTSLTVSGTVTLTWTATTSAYATGTRVYRSTTSGGPYTQIAQIVGLATTTYNDAPGAGTFFYVVAAYYNAGGANWTSPNSNEARYGTCSLPGTTTVTTDADSYTDSGAVSSNFGTLTTANLDANKINYAYLHFVNPSMPAGCMVTSATLSATFTALPNSTKPTISVYRAATAWSETTLTWSTQPAVTGTAATGAPSVLGSFTWTVTTQVQATYSASNYGFELQAAGANGTDVFKTRESATPATLAVTFG